MVERIPSLTEPLSMGEGVSLRRWRDEDAPAVVAASNDPELARWIPVPQPYTLADAQTYIENTRAWWTAGERFVFCIARDGEAVGSVALRLDSAEASIGYWLAPAARGAGLMTRAVQALVEWAASELSTTSFAIYVEAENVSSGRWLSARASANTATAMTFPMVGDASRIAERVKTDCGPERDPARIRVRSGLTLQWRKRHWRIHVSAVPQIRELFASADCTVLALVAH